MALADSVVKQLDPQVRSYIEDLEQRTESLSHENEQLTQQTEFLSEEIQSLEEKLQLALFKRFGRSSERSTVASGQADLFSEADDT
jgi:cell division septum initiation protein DivIVA